MTTKNASVRRVSKVKKLGLKKETLKDLAVQAQAAREVRGNVSTVGRLGNNYAC